MGLKKAGKSAAKAEKSNGKKEKILKEVEVGDYTVRVELYHGKPSFGIHMTSRIEAGEDYTLIVGFGLPKAKAILECADEIKEFVEEHGNE